MIDLIVTMIINIDHEDQDSLKDGQNDFQCDQDDQDGVNLHSSGSQGGLTGSPCLLGTIIMMT